MEPTILIPCLNEATTVANCVREAHGFRGGIEHGAAHLHRYLGIHVPSRPTA